MVPDPLAWNALVSAEAALPPYPEECAGTGIEGCSGWSHAMAAASLIDDPYSIRAAGSRESIAMFRRRSEIEKFLAVAEAGKVVAAAGRPPICTLEAAMDLRTG